MVHNNPKQSILCSLVC